MFQPIVAGIVTLAVAAAGGIIAVVGLVVLDGRRSPGSPRTGVERRLPEAA
jgi:hypothetical protein